MKKSILIFSFISILFISSFSSEVSACSCVQLPNVEEELERSNAVFSGKVIDVREKRSLTGNVSKLVLFEVTSTWKGVQQSQIMITTGLDSGDCGIDFKGGKEYLVYASESTMYGAKSLVSIICDRTNQLSSLQSDLAILGEGKPPHEKVDLTGEFAGYSSYICGAVIGVIAIVLIVIVKRRKNKVNG